VAAAATREYFARFPSSETNHLVTAAFEELRRLHEKKLWHQLTLVLEALVDSRLLQNQADLLGLYDFFVKDFESRLNQLTLAKILVKISRSFSVLQDAVDFLERTTKRIKSESEPEAYAFASSNIACSKIRQGKLDDAKQLTDQVSVVLESIAGIDSMVYSAYYEVLALYFKAKIMPTEFYKNSILFLQYTPSELIPVNDQRLMAFDIGIAALVSTEIYNFGELLAHPILATLKNTNLEWLNGLLLAVNSGLIDVFNDIWVKSADEINLQPVFKQNEALLREKICMLAVVELVFSRASKERVLPFSLVAQKTRRPVEQVEMLLMKVFSLGLARGQIDEVEQTVCITWIQPRTLDMKQLAKMLDGVRHWCDVVHEVLVSVQNESHAEIFT